MTAYIKSRKIVIHVALLLKPLQKRKKKKKKKKH
jgi:hypothetical protein